MTYFTIFRSTDQKVNIMFLQTHMHDVSTPQTDYHLAGHKFKDIIINSKDVFAGLLKNTIINKIFDKKKIIQYTVVNI